MDEIFEHLLRSLIALLALLLLVAARHHRELRPLAVFVAWMFVAGRTRGALDPVFAGEAAPYEGWLALALGVDRLLYMSVPFLFVWTCGALFAGKWTRRYALLAFVSVGALVTFGYPTIGADAFAQLIVTYSVVNLTVMWVTSLRAALGHAGVQPKLVHLAFLVFLATDSVVHLYGWVNQVDEGISGLLSQWTLTRALNVFSFAFGVGVVVRILLRDRRQRGATLTST